MTLRNLPRPAGVVFDCDGLLVDTEPCWTVAESAVFAARGLSYGAAEKEMFIGRSMADTVAMMARIFEEPGSEGALTEEMLERIVAVIAADAAAMPGAHGIVAAIGSQVPIAVASNSLHAIVEVALNAGGLRDAFEVVVAVDDVARGKPAPDLYTTACARLGIPAPASVAFEDTVTGLASARAAGLTTIGVPSLTGLDFPADWVVSRLDDPHLLDWVRSW